MRGAAVATRRPGCLPEAQHARNGKGGGYVRHMDCSDGAAAGVFRRDLDGVQPSPLRAAGAAPPGGGAARRGVSPFFPPYAYAHRRVRHATWPAYAWVSLDGKQGPASKFTSAGFLRRAAWWGVRLPFHTSPKGEPHVRHHDCPSHPAVPGRSHHLSGVHAGRVHEALPASSPPVKGRRAAGSTAQVAAKRKLRGRLPV